MSFTNPYPASRLTLDATNSLSSGLVGFWPLTDGTGTTAKDITSNANDGTQSGGVSWASTDIGTAASFDAYDDYFETGFDPAVGQSAITISAWFLTNGTGQYCITGFGNDAAGQKFSLSIENGVIFSRNWLNVVSGGSGYNDGVFHHIVLTKPSGGTISAWSCFVDSSPVSLSVVTGGSDTLDFVSSSFTLQLGRQPKSSSPFLFYGGKIQNVRIYNRALSATEVATLFNRPWESTNYGDLWPYSPPVPSSMSLSTDTAATSLMSGCV